MEALKMEDRVDSWNDDRLDELSGRMDEGFKEMREGFARVDREMKEGFAKVDREMKDGFAKVDREMKDGFAKVDQEMKAGFAGVRGEMRYIGERVDRLAHALTVGGISFGLTAFATIAGLVVTQV